MKKDSSTERVLLEQLRTGQPGAVDSLATAYGSKVYQLAFRYMKNREDAEEVAQDVLMKVVNKVQAFRGDAALSSWIYRITFNTAMSRLRNGKFTRPAEVSEHDLPGLEHEDGVRRVREAPDWTSLADEAFLRGQLRSRLADAMKDLPEIYRTPIVLRDIQGLSTEEASRVLNVKSQTLKSRLHRGRLILRSRLADFSTGLTLHSSVA
ncbi:MAG: RNA polymerase sigma factor [Luteitalea sp.]|nr:sigma-70 family RNA polymerase sigma factor [Acidobacteriota bacterium]